MNLLSWNASKFYDGCMRDTRGPEAATHHYRLRVRKHLSEGRNHFNPVPRFISSGAEEIQAKERAALERMQKGDSLPTLLNFDEHWSAVTKQSDSKLAFRPI